MPSWILGAVKASDMTTFFPLAVYASIQKELGRPLEFPGDSAAFEKIMPMSSGVLNSYLHEWMVLEESARNERFNIVDDSEFTWLKAWPVIAGWFGMEWLPPREEEEGEYEVAEMPLRPRGYVSSFSAIPYLSTSQLTILPQPRSQRTLSLALLPQLLDARPGRAASLDRPATTA